MQSKEKLKLNIKKEILKFENKLESLIVLSKNYSLLRLIVFILSQIFFFGFYLYSYKITAIVIGSILGLIFLILMHNHSKIEKSIKKFRVYIQIKKEELARLELDWDNIPLLDNSSVNNPSDIEQDLNITEKHGLLQLISIGVTFESITILREWLSGKNINFNDIIARQKIVHELKKIRRFRVKLILSAKLSINYNIAKAELAEWIKSTKTKKGLKVYTVFLGFIAVLNLFFFGGWLLGFFNTYYYQILLLYLFIYFAGYNYVRHIKDISEFLSDEVRKYYSVFDFIENYNYGQNNSVKSFLQPFLKAKSSPSKVLKKINLTVEILYLGKNPFVWFLLICIAPLDYLLSIKVETFKKSIKNDFPIWLNTWHELEAYSSLAEFAYLNSDYTFPEFAENSDILNGRNLGHPLIKSDQKITNNFLLSESNKTNIITGSNMSGKSTFLRTIGINVLLAYAGSVVNAQKFSISKINLFTCINVSDSVVDGISYFYSEVKRLKEIIEEVKTSYINSLVLIDEIYKGTNNVERLIGSRALIKYFSKQNIYNIVSTHDLELVKIAEELANVRNFHFKEIIQDSKMSFDFRLMHGPCPTTNALKIMKLEGLPT